MSDDLEQYIADQGPEFAQLVDDHAEKYQQYRTISGRPHDLSPSEMAVDTTASDLVCFDVVRDGDVECIFVELPREDVERLHAQLGAWLGGVDAACESLAAIKAEFLRLEGLSRGGVTVDAAKGMRIVLDAIAPLICSTEGWQRMGAFEDGAS